MSQVSGQSQAIDISKDTSDLNSAILWVFFAGIYTMFYANTVYAYGTSSLLVTKGKAQRLLVVTTITAIYIISMLQVGTLWWITIWQFAEHGGDDPIWWSALQDFNGLTIYILSDVLLIWRCFCLFNGSFRVMALPFVLLVAEICLMTATVAYRALTNEAATTSKKDALRGNGLYLATYITSLFASVLATSLISYRIYSTSKRNDNSVGRFKPILRIITESSLFSSLSLLVSIIDCIVDDATFNGSVNVAVYAFDDYIFALAVLISALAPTIMVARVAQLTPEKTHAIVISPMSGYQYRDKGHSSSYNDLQDSVGSLTVVEHGGNGFSTKMKEVV
ncbi:hypothetical protein GALMADRAFT_145690 [Galerina marginata CBS 339.88]|uniref:Uncharacterized protein n=1 Tax=Galerina marginata (strain CBS 339.88) TaxID=685588 RepID=A0A067SNM4_GALM3|nr:hypothetical protein GALMADRAFT_145690 [Galerina marginata CBS 339.88]